jgi:hypothetical protein
MMQIILLYYACKPKAKEILKNNASGRKIIFRINQTEVDAKLNVYDFEKLHLQPYV